MTCVLSKIVKKTSVGLMLSGDPGSKIKGCFSVMMFCDVAERNSVRI